MNDTPSSKPEMKQASPAKPGQEAVEASDSGKPWILGMAAAVMLIVGLVIGSILWSAPNMASHVEPMLHMTSNEEYQRAYRTAIAPEWRAVTSEQDFQIIHENLRRVMGKLVSLKQTGYQEQEVPQLGIVAQVTFQGRFDNGPVEVTALLKKAGQGWAIVGMGYASPQLDQAATQAPAPPTRRQAAPATTPAASQPAQE